MKVYTQLSGHVDTITPKLLAFDWNALEFKPRGNGPEYTATIDPKTLDIPASQATDAYPVNLKQIEIWLWSKSKYDRSGGRFSPGEYITFGNDCSIRLNLILDHGVSLADIVSLLLHELKHYYDDHYNRKLHDVNYNPEGTAANYFMHNVEFLPQAYSLAMSTLEMPSTVLFDYLKRAVTVPNLDFDEVRTLQVPKVLRTSMLSINYYLFGEHHLYREGTTVNISIEEKSRRIGVFMRVVAQVRNKLSRYLQSFNNVQFAPKLLSWKEIAQRDSKSTKGKRQR